MPGNDPVQTQLTRVRALCLALPEVSERLSHSAPTFFVRGKASFVTFHDDHHGDGRLAIWCAAPDGMQELVLDASPERYFRPPYVGHRGWLGVHLDDALGDAELEGVVEDAYRACAPKTLVRRLDLS